MEQKIIEIAADVLKMTEEEVLAHVKPVPELEAFYFWKPTRGGASVIIKSNGEKLAASSVVGFEKLKEAFIDGRRN